MQHLTANKIVGLEAMARDLVANMITAGFTLIAVDGAIGTQIGQSSKKFYLTASASIDPLYATQKWGMVISANDSQKKLSINVLPDLQVSETTFEAVMRTETVQVGRLSRNGLLASSFIDLVADWGMDATADLSAFPLTYDLITTDHGVALHVCAESFDNTGRAFSWFVVQRGIQAGDTVPGDHSPLFSVFSCGGGLLGDPDTLVATAIQRYTVIETGVNAATAPISAVAPSADGTPIINPLQQVMIAENNRAVVLFPQIINTQRYVYFATLDMLGYTSADVLSAGTVVELTPAGTALKYRGMNANGRDNRGMRLLLPIEVA